ncbi:MAG: Holliday junction resolvase RuvX [Corynebacterium sp.]|nr:Holliday junction resolvase RuvX [Corynebacterium sp.]
MAKPTPDRPGTNDPGPGRRLALDVGTARIGVAVSDRDCVLATPVETVPRDSGFNGPDGNDIHRILELVVEYSVVEIVIGLPRQLSGGHSISIKHAKEIGFRLNRKLSSLGLSIPVIRYADERLTTVIATHALQSSGVKAKDSRAIIDQAAAVEILQAWLDGRRHALARETAED